MIDKNSLDDDLADFILHSENFWKHIKAKKSKAANLETDAGNKIVEKWAKQGAAESTLLSLIRHNSASVRFAAAAHLLNCEPKDAAISVLRELMKDPEGLIAPSARLTLMRNGIPLQGPNSKTESE